MFSPQWNEGRVVGRLYNEITSLEVIMIVLISNFRILALFCCAVNLSKTKKTLRKARLFKMASVYIQPGSSTD